MKNSCVIFPCCFCQKYEIFFVLFLSLSLPLPPLAVTLIICPSKLAFPLFASYRLCFNTPFSHQHTLLRALLFLVLTLQSSPSSCLPA